MVGGKSCVVTGLLGQQLNLVTDIQQIMSLLNKRITWSGFLSWQTVGEHPSEEASF